MKPRTLTPTQFEEFVMDQAKKVGRKYTICIYERNDHWLCVWEDKTDSQVSIRAHSDTLDKARITAADWILTDMDEETMMGATFMLVND